MENETVKISKCCKREAIEYSEKFYMCSQCGLACKVTEVCVDCLGTKEISIDQEDGEGHTERGVGTEKCRKCMKKE